MTDFKNVGVGLVDGVAKLQITFEDEKVAHIPLNEQVALVLNAGGWMMREFAARLFAETEGEANEVSKRLRALPIGGLRADGGPAPQPAPPGGIVQ